MFQIVKFPINIFRKKQAIGTDKSNSLFLFESGKTDLKYGKYGTVKSRRRTLLLR